MQDIITETNIHFENIIENIASNGVQIPIHPKYKTDNTALYAGDCLEIMQRFPDNYVDMIFVDRI